MLPPSLMTQDLPRGTVLDWSGNAVDSETRPAAENVAQTGRMRDPWLMQIALDITPSSLARMVKNDFPLPMQMALCSRMLDNDAHLASVYRDLVGGVAGLDSEVLPFDDSADAERYRKTCEDWTKAKSEDLEDIMPMLIAGEYYPVAGVGMIWDTSTYLPDRFIEIDPVRWYWDSVTNSLKIRTKANPYFGEDLPPNQFILYRSALRPGKGREGGLWRPSSWLYLQKHFVVSEWLEFTELYGKPFRLAFYNRREDKDSIYQAMLNLGANGAGVFPAGTVVDVKQSNATGSVEAYRTLREACNDEMSELFVGHSLITHAKSGTGTLAGGGAQKVHEKIIRAVARRFSRVLGRYVYRAIIRMHYGEAAVAKTPNLKLKYEPPDDEEKKAKTFVLVNQALQAVGEAIDPEQIRETFNIAKTVKRTAPGAADPAAGDPSADENDDPIEKPENAAARRRARASNDTTPLLSADDVEEVAAQIGKKSLKDFGSRIRSAADSTDSIAEFMSSLWEDYSAYETASLGGLTRDAIVTAELIGRGEVADE
jgi:phage gp29-like protein